MKHMLSCNSVIDAGVSFLWSGSGFGVGWWCRPILLSTQESKTQLDDLVRPVSEKSVCVCVAEDMTG